MLNGYGQAEIGEVIGWTTADAKAHPDRIGAVGRAHAGVEIRIAEPDDNGVGELLVRPPSTAIDLADDRVTTDGFVRTGDLARIDDADFVWIEGRAGDLINRGGNKVFPMRSKKSSARSPVSPMSPSSPRPTSDSAKFPWPRSSATSTTKSSTPPFEPTLLPTRRPPCTTT